MNVFTITFRKSLYNYRLCSDTYALFGIDNLDTKECLPPCQMRKITSWKDPGYDYQSMRKDIAIATIDFPVIYTKEVGSSKQLIFFSYRFSTDTEQLVNRNLLLC